jgi:hypothetical protein
MSIYYTMKKVLAHPKEKDGQPGYEITYKDGYVSWCPKEVFENCSIRAENIDW